MKNREDAEEVTQDVLMKVYRRSARSAETRRFHRGFTAITFNTAMSRLRTLEADAGRLEQHEPQPRRARTSSATPRQPADWSNMPDEELLRRALRQAVVAAMQELPEIYRAPVMLRDIEGLSDRGGEHRLHVKDQTLKSRLHRGRLMLRARLQAFTNGLSLHRPTPAYSLRLRSYGATSRLRGS